MNLTRTAALALSLLMIAAVFTACGDSSNPNLTVDTTGTQTEATLPVPELSRFVLTRPEKGSAIITMLQTLHAKIKEKTGLELKLGDDFVLPGKIDEPEYEILLGKVDREVSRAVYGKLEKGGYAVVRTEKKIIIAGDGQRPLQAALEYFLTNYLGENGLVYPAETEYYAVYHYDYYNDVLCEKTINLLGDSYIAGESLSVDETWGGILADKYGMTLNRYGKGGNGLASPEASGTPMYLRYTEMKNDADIVFVVGGRNDYNKRYPVGSVGDTAADSFCGALSILIDGLREKYPNALILFSTPWYVNEEMKAYSDAMLAVCAQKQIPCFNAADQTLSGVYMNDSAFRAKYCMQANDVSHLNADGMALYFPAVEQFIAEEAEAFWKK